MVANDDLAVADDAVEELGAGSDRQLVVLGHAHAGLRVGARGEHEVGDAGVQVCRAATPPALAHDAVDDAEAEVNNKASVVDVVRVVDGVRVLALFSFLLRRAVPPVFAAAKAVRARGLFRLVLVDDLDIGLDLEQADQVAKGGGDHRFYLRDTGLNTCREGPNGSLRRREVRISAELAFGEPDHGVRVVAPHRNAKQGFAVVEELFSVRPSPVSRVLGLLRHTVHVPHVRVAIAVLCDVADLEVVGVPDLARLFEEHLLPDVDDGRDEGPLLVVLGGPLLGGHRG